MGLNLQAVRENRSTFSAEGSGKGLMRAFNRIFQPLSRTNFEGTDRACAPAWRLGLHCTSPKKHTRIEDLAKTDAMQFQRAAGWSTS